MKGETPRIIEIAKNAGFKINEGSRWFWISVTDQNHEGKWWYYDGDKKIAPADNNAVWESGEPNSVGRKFHLQWLDLS